MYFPKAIYRDALPILNYIPGQNIFEQINRYMSGSSPLNPINNVISVCRETATLLEEVGERLFIQALLSVKLQNLLQIFWPGLSFKSFFKRLLVVFKTKKVWSGERADNFNFLKSVYCNMKLPQFEIRLPQFVIR